MPICASGAEIHLNKLSLLVDSLSSQNANPRFSAEGNVSLSTVTLQDGERYTLKPLVKLFVYIH